MKDGGNGFQLTSVGFIHLVGLLVHCKVTKGLLMFSGFWFQLCWVETRYIIVHLLCKWVHFGMLDASLERHCKQFNTYFVVQRHKLVWSYELNLIKSSTTMVNHLLLFTKSRGKSELEWVSLGSDSILGYIPKELEKVSLVIEYMQCLSKISTLSVLTLF